MKLYHNPLSPNARRAMAVIEQLSLDVELHTVDFMKGEHKAPEFLKLNPNGMVPVLIDEDFVLFESRAIMQYLAGQKPEAGLWPDNARARADIARWQFWDAEHFGNALGTLAFERMLKPMMGIGEPNEVLVKNAEAHLARFSKVLETHLSGREFLVGKALTIADFTLAASLQYAGPSGVSLDPYPGLKAWFGRIDELPAWRKTAPKM